MFYSAVRWSRTLRIAIMLFEHFLYISVFQKSIRIITYINTYLYLYELISEICNRNSNHDKKYSYTFERRYASAGRDKSKMLYKFWLWIVPGMFYHIEWKVYIHKCIALWAWKDSPKDKIFCKRLMLLVIKRAVQEICTHWKYH